MKRDSVGFLLDGRVGRGARIKFSDSGDLFLNDNEWQKVELAKPTALVEEFEGLIGEYGWDHNVLFVYEQDGQLYTLIEWLISYPLERVDNPWITRCVTHKLTTLADLSTTITQAGNNNN